MKLLNSKKTSLFLFYFFFMYTPLLICNNKPLTEEEILRAAEHGDTETFVSLIQNKQNINIQDKDGNNPIHLAAKNGHYKIIELLVAYDKNPQGLFNILRHALIGSKSPNINAQNNDGNTPLHCATDNNATEALIILLWQNANTSILNKKKQTALLLAAERGKKENVVCLMGMSDEYYNHKINGNNILHVALTHQHQDLIEELITLENKIDKQAPQKIRQHITQEKNSLGETPFIYCVKTSNQRALELLLSNNTTAEADINTPDNQGYLPLSYACHHNKSELIKTLVNKKANLNISTITDAMPLHIALKNHNYSLATQLLNLGANIDAHDSQHHYSPLLIATLNNDQPQIDWLLKYGADIKKCDKQGNDSLGIAIIKGHKHLLPLFISHGANIDSIDANNRTWLMRELAKKNNDMANYLIQLKANTNHIDRDGQTALHITTVNNNINGSKLLLQHNKQLISKHNKQGNTPLHYAADHPTSSEFVTLYLSYNASINAQNVYGETPLHRAVTAGNIETIQHLKKNKASLTLLTKNNNSPAHYALIDNNVNCLPLVLSKEIINTINNDGHTVLFLAIKKSLPHHMLQKIMDYGVDIRQVFNNGDNYLHHAITNKNRDAITLLALPPLIDQKNNFNCSPISYAAQHNDMHTVQLLLQRNAMLNISDNNGWTELHHAVVSSDIALFKVLCAYGSCVKKITCDGNTCLHIAAQYNKQDIISEIKKNNPYLKRKNDAGQTPFMVAAYNNNLEAVKLLISEDDFNDGTVETVVQKIKSTWALSQTRIFLEKELNKLANACNDIIKLQNDLTLYENECKKNDVILKQKAIKKYARYAYQHKQSPHKIEFIDLNSLKKMPQSKRNEHITLLRINLQHMQNEYAQQIKKIDEIDHSIKCKEQKKLRQLKEQEELQRLAQEKQAHHIQTCNKNNELQNQLQNTIKENNLMSSLIKQKAIKEHAHYMYPYQAPNLIDIIYSMEKIKQLNNAELYQHRAFLQNHIQTEQKKHAEMLKILETINQKTSIPATTTLTPVPPANQKEELSQNEISNNINNDEQQEETECDLCNELKQDAQHRCTCDKCPQKLCLDCVNGWKAKGKNTCPYCFFEFQKQ